MEKLELYHIHVLGNHDRIWHENSKLIVKDNFRNGMYNRYQNFTTAIPIDDGDQINLHDLLTTIKYNGINIDESLLNDLISYGFHVSYYASMFKRENALENYRLATNNDKPSRLHSIYLTDEKGVEGWLKKLDQKSELYRVEAEGNIFKTSEYLIPREILSYEQTYNEAYKYWNPSFKKIADDANEYLVQGNIKILEKIR